MYITQAHTRLKKKRFVRIQDARTKLQHSRFGFFEHSILFQIHAFAIKKLVKDDDAIYNTYGYISYICIIHTPSCG